MQTKEATVTVERTMYASGDPKGEPKERKGTLAVHEFVTAPGSFGTTLSANINLGNYESVKVSVHVTLPGYAEEAERVLAAAHALAEAHLGMHVGQVVEHMKKTTKDMPRRKKR